MTTFRCEASTARPKPRQAWRWAIALLIALGLAVAGLFLRARSFDSELPPPLAASAAIPVTLLDGKRTTLGHVVRPGWPTVISLWASWCGPCRREEPALAELYRRAHGRINLVYLNVRDSDAETKDLARVMADAGLPVNLYARMGDDQIGALTGAMDVKIPRTLIFDRSGMPLGRITGFNRLALNRVAGLVGL